MNVGLAIRIDYRAMTLRKESTWCEVHATEKGQSHGLRHGERLSATLPRSIAQCHCATPASMHKSFLNAQRACKHLYKTHIMPANDCGEISKRPVSEAQTGCFATPNGLFWTSIQAILQCTEQQHVMENGAKVILIYTRPLQHRDKKHQHKNK